MHPVESSQPGDARRTATGVAISRRFPGGDFVSGRIEDVFVARGGEIGHPLRGDFVHRGGDRAVLEERLFEPADIVDDHLRPGPPFGDGARQPFDVLGERFFAFEGGGEGE